MRMRRGNLKKDNDIKLSKDLKEEVVDNPTPIKELIKQDFIEYVNKKKGYAYITDESSEINK
jgi:nucleoid-associated protein YejK